MKIKPVGNKLLVRRDRVADETKTESGLVLPSVAREQPSTATILAIGEKVESYKPEQKVYLPRFCGTNVLAGTDQLTLIEVDDILALCEEG